MRRAKTSIAIRRDVFALVVLFAESVGESFSRVLEVAAIEYLQAQGQAVPPTLSAPRPPNLPRPPWVVAPPLVASPEAKKREPRPPRKKKKAAPRARARRR